MCIIYKQTINGHELGGHIIGQGEGVCRKLNLIQPMRGRFRLEIRNSSQIFMFFPDATTNSNKNLICFEKLLK